MHYACALLSYEVCDWLYCGVLFEHKLIGQMLMLVWAWLSCPEPTVVWIVTDYRGQYSL